MATRAPACSSKLAWVVCLAAIGLLGSGAARAEPTLSILPLAFGVTEFRGPASRVASTVASTDAFRESRPALVGPLVVLWGQEGGAVVTLAGDDLAVRSFTRGQSDLPALERGRTAIPSSRSAVADGLTVTLDDATRDYPHEALGSPVHARTVTIVERRAAPPAAEPRPVPTATARISAGPGAVFEDREPRLSDLDEDGVPEILVVRSYRDRGSALAVIDRRDGVWALRAETPADGEPFRWLNPASSGGLGPGHAREIALVRRPHLDGVLQIWRWTGTALELVAEKPGYSNHAFGSSAQDLAATSTDEAGAARIALPTLDRRSLAIVSLAGGRLEEVARVALPARALTGVAILGKGRATRIIVGLEGGKVAAIRP